MAAMQYNQWQIISQCYSAHNHKHLDLTVKDNIANTINFFPIRPPIDVQYVIRISHGFFELPKNQQRTEAKNYYQKNVTSLNNSQFKFRAKINGTNETCSTCIVLAHHCASYFTHALYVQFGEIILLLRFTIIFIDSFFSRMKLIFCYW